MEQRSAKLVVSGHAVEIPDDLFDDELVVSVLYMAADTSTEITVTFRGLHRTGEPEPDAPVLTEAIRAHLMRPTLMHLVRPSQRVHGTTPFPTHEVAGYNPDEGESL